MSKSSASTVFGAPVGTPTGVAHAPPPHGVDVGPGVGVVVGVAIGVDVDDEAPTCTVAPAHGPDTGFDTVPGGVGGGCAGSHEISCTAFSSAVPALNKTSGTTP